MADIIFIQSTDFHVLSCDMALLVCNNYNKNFVFFFSRVYPAYVNPWQVAMSFRRCVILG